MARWLEALSDNIAIDKDKCVFCGECVKHCILDNLRFKASPCREACPLKLNCQGYVQLISRGEEEKALKTIFEAVPFPGILGRVCTSPCETICSRNKVDEAVSIKGLKRYLADLGWSKENQSWQEWLEKNLSIWQPSVKHEERIAIIGGGPAGIVAACHLHRYGYQVTLIDAGANLGGMLTRCVPSFRLPAEVIADELQILKMLDIDIKLNTLIDEDVLKELIEEYDAVLVSTGLPKSSMLNSDAENISGIYGAIDFLSYAKSDIKRVKAVCGKRVVVIGGGSVAVDAAQVAKRLGAGRVEIICLEQADEMPVVREELQEALQEGITINNGWGLAQIKTDQGKLSELELQSCLMVYDESGNFSPVYSDDKEILPADILIYAIGQQADLNFVQELLPVKNNRIAVNEISYQTSREKVFAAGDIVEGLNTVVDAMSQGQEAAESIHRFLRGMPLIYGRNDNRLVMEEAEIDTLNIEKSERISSPVINVNERNGFEEYVLSLIKAEAQKEGTRCISCGEPYGKHRTCWSCLPCEVECPEKALRVNVPFIMK